MLELCNKISKYFIGNIEGIQETIVTNTKTMGTIELSERVPKGMHLHLEEGLNEPPRFFLSINMPKMIMTNTIAQCSENTVPPSET